MSGTWWVLLALVAFACPSVILFLICYLCARRAYQHDIDSDERSYFAEREIEMRDDR